MFFPTGYSADMSALVRKYPPYSPTRARVMVLQYAGEPPSTQVDGGSRRGS